jgi:LCP family protein required for cell wall assembly
VGVDSGWDRDHALTDTLMVASFDQSHDQVTMISIPRDTGRFPLYTGGYYKNRINTFLNYAGRNPAQYPEGPIKALMREIGYIVGIRIDYYASTNLDGFPGVVDLVGGVDVVNPKRFLLRGSGATGTYLDPGPYHLDGDFALQYVRARHGLNNSDWQRARRQQQVIAAIAERALATGVAARLPEIIAAMANLARTDANPADMQTLLPILTRATTASAEHIVLQPSTYARRIPPGEVNGRYMTELNIAAVREMSIRVFGKYSRYY